MGGRAKPSHHAHTAILVVVALTVFASRAAVAADFDSAELGDVLRRLSAEARTAPTERGARLHEAAAPALIKIKLGRLILSCAPTTPPGVVRALIDTESGGRPLLISENAPERQSFQPSSREDAESRVAELTRRGANFDVGLMQVNSATAAGLGVPTLALLDPCRSVTVGAAIFDRGYAKALASGAAVMPILSAYSLYNTGSVRRGLSNGYADRVAIRLKLRSRRDRPTPALIN